MPTLIELVRWLLIGFVGGIGFHLAARIVR